MSRFPQRPVSAEELEPPDASLPTSESETPMVLPVSSVLPVHSSTVHGDRQRSTDIPHSLVAQAAESINEHSDGHTLDRVEVDGAPPRDWITARLEQYLTRQASDGRGARGDKGSPEAWNGSVAAQHQYRPTADLRQLAPPQFAPVRLILHNAAAAERNDARSPHSSGSSSGCSSYAA